MGRPLHRGPEGLQDLDLPVELKGYRHVFHLYVIETKKPEWRDPLVDHPGQERH